MITAMTESDERPDSQLDDERRRYYRMTEYGRRVLSAEVERLAKLVHVARVKQLTGESSSRVQFGAL